nr:MAG TPA: NUMOD4 motif protein [Caudoviricetes sp.]
MVWKEIKGYEGRYMVSDTGKIMSLPRTIKTSRGYRTISKKRILKCSKLRNGTKVIRLVDKDGNKKNYTVAQIVARTFIENDDPKRTFVRHIDGKEGNNVKNLKWDYPGRAASTDYRFKRRKKSKNRNTGPIQAFKNNVFCGEFQTATEAARHFGFKNTVGICLCLKEKQKTVGGMEWRRKEES